MRVVTVGVKGPVDGQYVQVIHFAGKKHGPSLMVLEKSKVFPEFWGELFWLSAKKILKAKEISHCFKKKWYIVFPLFLEHLGRQFRHLIFQTILENTKNGIFKGKLLSRNKLSPNEKE